MQIFGDYIIEFDISALIVLSIVYWMVWRFKNLPSEITLLYKLLLVSGILASIFDVVSVAVLSPELHTNIIIQNIAQMLYLIPNMMCAVFYFSLSSVMTSSFRKRSNLRRYITFAITIVDSLLVITSPFTHLYFHISDGVYHGNGVLIYLRYFIAIAITLMAMFDSIRYHRLMTRRQKQLTYTYTIACLICIAIQFMNPNLLILNFGVACSSLLGYYALQRPTDFKDDLTGLSNKYSFSHIMSTLFHQGDKFSLICIEYPELHYVDTVIGSNASHDLIKQIAVQLQGIVNKTWLYRVSHTRFIVVLPHRSEDIPEYATAIRKASDTPLQTNGVVFHMRPLICTLHAPESMTYAEDVMDAVDFGLSQAKKAPEEVYFNVEEAAIIRRRRDSAIIHVLNRAISNEEFEVNFQPVIEVESKTFTRAEALASLNDRVLGRISPAEFIPIAEQNGIIIKLGETVFDTVCKFVKKNIDDGSCLKRISVNLSPVQCMQADLADSIIKIAERNNVPLKYFEFEITSDTLNHGAEILFPNMHKLHDLGVGFTVDNYAVNITDTPRFSKAPVETIKISREVIFALLEDKRMLPAMKNSIAALKELGYKVVATGIETKETSDIFKSYGCDYLQGFYFSEPVTAAQFSSMLRNS